MEEGKGRDREEQKKSKFSVNSNVVPLPQAVINEGILRREYVSMLSFICLVQSEMPFLAMGNIMPV